MRSQQTTIDQPPQADISSLDQQLSEAVKALDKGWYDDVLLIGESVLAEAPLCPEAVFLMGLAAFDMGDPVRGLALVEKAHELDPEVQEYADALAALYAKLAKVNEALFYAKLSTTLDPHPRIGNLLPDRFGSFFLNLMSSGPYLLRERAQNRIAGGQFHKAVADCHHQLELTPSDTETLRLLARACLETGETGRAVAAYQAILHGEEGCAKDQSDLAVCLSAAGRHDEARACHLRALDLSRGSAELHSRLLHDQTRRPATGFDEVEAAHRDWQRDHCGSIETRTLRTDRDPERPLRIGYISGAFVLGDEMRLFEPVVKSHDRSQFEVFAYSGSARQDIVTESLRQSFRRWTVIAGIDDETLAEIIRGDGIDVLVDLSGHGPGGRPLVLARRPAPVMVNWLGACHPAGVGPGGHFLTDHVAWPEDRPDPGTGDRLWRMNRAALVHRASTTLPAPSEPPCAKAGHVTFGASCDLARVEPETAAVWAGVLDRVEGSRLLICNRRGLDQPAIDHVLDHFANLGRRDRVDVVNPAENFAIPADFYGYIDIALDTADPMQFAENALALTVGVPVLTLAGDRHATRLGASLLNAAGRPDWVACDRPGLYAAAADLAGDPERLSALRAALRDQVTGSDLCDVTGFTRDLEDAYRNLWRAFCEAPHEDED